MKKGVSISLLISLIFLIVLMPIVNAGMFDWFKDFFGSEDLEGELRSGGGGCSTDADCGVGGCCGVIDPNDPSTNYCTPCPTVSECTSDADCQSGDINIACCDSPGCVGEETGNGICTCDNPPVNGVCPGQGCNPLDCDDNNDCTTDSCSNGACVNTAISPAPTGCGSGCTPMNCNDNNACTDDLCVNGNCQNTQINCDDGLICTTDSCSNGVCSNTYMTGCVSTCFTLDCNDDNDCTTDSCSNGACVNTAISPAPTGCGSGCTPMNCNDNNACTDDLCVNNNCQNTQMNCDDGEDCTTDSCSNGACVNILDMTLEECNECGGDEDCIDTEYCTVDSCFEGTCYNEVDPSIVGCGCEDDDYCDDENECTIDTCSDGLCSYELDTSINPLCCVSDEHCDDGSFCTVDSCVDSNCQNTDFECETCSESGGEESFIENILEGLGRFFSRLFNGESQESNNQNDDEGSEEVECELCCDDECPSEDVCGITGCCGEDETCILTSNVLNQLNPYECVIVEQGDCTFEGNYQCGEQNGYPLCCSIEDNPTCVENIGCCEEGQMASTIGCVDVNCEEECQEEYQDNIFTCLPSFGESCYQVYNPQLEDCLQTCCEDECESTYDIDCSTYLSLDYDDCVELMDSAEEQCLQECVVEEEEPCNSAEENCCPTLECPDYICGCEIEEDECCEPCGGSPCGGDNTCECDTCNSEEECNEACQDTSDPQACMLGITGPADPYNYFRFIERIGDIEYSLVDMDEYLQEQISHKLSGNQPQFSQEAGRNFVQSLENDLDDIIDEITELKTNSQGKCPGPITEQTALQRMNHLRAALDQYIASLRQFATLFGAAIIITDQSIEAYDQTFGMIDELKLAIMEAEVEKRQREYDLAFFKCSVARSFYSGCVNTVADQCQEDIGDVESDIEYENLIENIDNAYNQCQADYDNSVSEEEQEMANYLQEYQQALENYVNSGPDQQSQDMLRSLKASYSGEGQIRYCIRTN
jgi:hypothetical protein